MEQFKVPNLSRTSHPFFSLLELAQVGKFNTLFSEKKAQGLENKLGENPSLFDLCQLSLFFFSVHKKKLPERSSTPVLGTKVKQGESTWLYLNEINLSRSIPMKRSCRELSIDMVKGYI